MIKINIYIIENKNIIMLIIIIIISINLIWNVKDKLIY